MSKPSIRLPQQRIISESTKVPDRNPAKNEDIYINKEVDWSTWITRHTLCNFTIWYHLSLSQANHQPSITLKRVRNWSVNILPASYRHIHLTFSWLHHLFENQATKPHTIQFHATAPSPNSGVIVDHHLAIRLGPAGMSRSGQKLPVRPGCIMSLRFPQD